jgi:tetratricopeptide (TPR) repeat protein
MNIHTNKYTCAAFISVFSLLLALAMISMVACQSAPQGYKSNPEAIQLNEQGMQCYDSGQYDRASMYFDRAAQADPSNPAVWFNKGQTLDAERKYDQAIDAYSQAIQLDGNFADAWSSKAVSYYNLDQSDKALESNTVRR